MNTAGRMESYSLPGPIQVSEATQRLLEKSHRLDYRGEIDIEEKGKFALGFSRVASHPQSPWER